MSAYRPTALYTLLVNVSLLLVLIVVVLSAWLRLNAFGVGCPDWPSCYGLLEPIEQASHGASLAPRTGAGLVHRVVASLLGLCVIGLVITAVRRRASLPGDWLPALALLVLTVFLSVLGYATPSPRMPLVAIANLMGGLSMAALLWWLSQKPAAARAHPVAGLRAAAWVLLVVVLAQVTLGGWVSANFAADACPGLPGCGVPWRDTLDAGAFNPLRSLILEVGARGGRLVPGAEGAGIHMVHRLGALLLALVLVPVAWAAWRRGAPVRRTGAVLLVLFAMQVALGAVAVAAKFPLWLVTAHNALATLLLLAAVNLVLLTRRQGAAG